METQSSTRRLVLLTVAAAFTWCCGGSNPPTAPTSTSQGVPSGLVFTPYTLSGTVVQRSTTGLQPIAGVTVGLYAWNEDVLVDAALVTSTQTDADGRYALQVEHPVPWLGASKPGYRYYAQSLPGDPVINIELSPSR